MDFVFVKKSKLYRLALYYLVWGLVAFHGVLLILNFALIRKDSNIGLVVFNTVFLGSMIFVLIRHVLPKYKYKVSKADYELFRISDGSMLVKYKEETKLYSFENELDHVSKIKFVPRITGSIDAISRLSYNVNIKFSDNKSITALLSYRRARDFVESIPNKSLTSRLSKQLDSDQDYYVTSHATRSKKAPSIVCFAVASLTLIYTLAIVFGYNTTTGTYYATELTKTNPRTPINTYSYQVEHINYSNREDYTISFGDNLNEDITVFYNADNPSDSYTMYTVDFLIFITGTLVIIGGILLNNRFSHYLAVIGLSIMPFFLIRLLNINVSTMFSTHILLPVLSMLSIPMYLLLSGLLKTGTDITKIYRERKYVED